MPGSIPIHTIAPIADGLLDEYAGAPVYEPVFDFTCGASASIAYDLCVARSDHGEDFTRTDAEAIVEAFSSALQEAGQDHPECVFPYLGDVISALQSRYISVFGEDEVIERRCAEFIFQLRPFLSLMIPPLDAIHGGCEFGEGDL